MMALLPSPAKTCSPLGAGFQSVVTVVRLKHFHIWALATKSPRKNEDLAALAEVHFPV